MDIVAETKAWVEAPFKQEMDLVHIFLLTGLVVVSVVLWSRVITRIA
jgi:hypothetical protein